MMYRCIVLESKISMQIYVICDEIDRTLFTVLKFLLVSSHNKDLDFLSSVFFKPIDLDLFITN